MELTKYAKIYLDRRLKSTTFNDSPEKYAEFIKTFGTHYFQDAFFGGMLKLLIETESSYFEKSTTVGVGLQAEGVFGEVVKLKGGVGVSNTNVDGNFKKSSKQSMRCVIIRLLAKEYWGVRGISGSLFIWSLMLLVSFPIRKLGEKRKKYDH